MTMMDSALATPVLYLPDLDKGPRIRKPFCVPEKMKVSAHERCTDRWNAGTIELGWMDDKPRMCKM